MKESTKKLSSASILSDQWKTAGDCKKCRRQSYCRRACLRHRERMISPHVANVWDHDMACAYIKAVAMERAKDGLTRK